MTADIRAKIYCDLGEVISGGFSDDHVQGSGLVRTRGDITIKGLVRPSYGQLVQLGWKKGTNFSRIPRALRVLSFFADPFRRITTIQLGCKFTLFENSKPGNEKDRYFYSKEDENNKDQPCQLYDVALLPISANNVALKCLQGLGITGNPGLTNWYAADKFDLDAGYVSVLNDLLYTEAKVAYLRADESLAVVDLRTTPNTNKVLRATDVIDIGPITGGEPPVDAVGVRYSYTRYKKPTTNSTSEDRWELEETTDPITTREIKYNQDQDTFTAAYSPYTKVQTEYDRFNRTVKKTTTKERHIAEINPKYIALLLDAGLVYPGIAPQFFTVYDIEEQYYDYERAADELQEAPSETAFECLSKALQEKLFNPDTDSQYIRQRTYRYVSDMQIAGTLGIQAYHFVNPTTGQTSVLHPGTAANRLAEYIEINNEKIQVEEPGSKFEPGNKYQNVSTITRQTTITKRAFFFDQQSQQLYADRALYINSTTQLQELIENATQLYSSDTATQVVTGKEFNVERRPAADEVADARNRKGIRVAEDTTEIEFITGNENSGNSRIYDLPLAPDDRINYLGGGVPGNWQIIQSDVKQKAVDFARAQNRLNLGHRYGFSLQLTAENLPPYPLDGIAVEASGALAMFRTNGTSWAFDSNGIVCNTDAVYWAGLGNTDPGYQIWFQVQPGITLLPSITPSVNANPVPVNNKVVDAGFDPNAALSNTENYGLITAGVTTSANWGLITAAPTTQIDWNADNGWATIPYVIAPVYAEYLQNPATVPAYLEQITQVFPVKMQMDVTRIDIIHVTVPLQAMSVRLLAIVPIIKPSIVTPVKVEVTVNAVFFNITAVVRIRATVDTVTDTQVGMDFGIVVI